MVEERAICWCWRRIWSSEAERPNCESGIEEGRVDGIEEAHITWSTGWVFVRGSDYCISFSILQFAEYVVQWERDYVRSKASMVRIWMSYHALGSRREKLWALCGCGSSRGELGTNQSPQLSENSRIEWADGHFLASPVWGTLECCVHSCRRIRRIGLQLLALHTACHTTSSWSLSNGAASGKARSERMRCQALHLFQASLSHCSVDSSTTVASPS